MLLEVSADEPVFARWRLDVPGVGGQPLALAEEAVKAACSLAGRNLTFTEWADYVGGTAPYIEVCPSYPTAQEQQPKDS